MYDDLIKSQPYNTDVLEKRHSFTKRSNWLWLICLMITSVTLILFSYSPLPARNPANEKPLIITYRGAESEIDVRYAYDTKLLQLALDKTLASDGPYHLIASEPMTFTRAKKIIQANSLPNFFIKLSYEDNYNALGMAYVPFPVDLGIVGYRVCFAAPAIIDRLAQVESLGELRNFSHGQGIGWSDTKILRYNGFTVNEIPGYESLFRMVATGRFDLFCRGINELLSEYNAHSQIEGLAIDQSMTIVYPLPRFFYTHANNTTALDRIHRGIVAAYQDGSLQELWQEEYQENIAFAKLGQRRVFRLNNPLLNNIGSDYLQYLYDPFKSGNNKK